jgi:hypothetical protein
MYTLTCRDCDETTRDHRGNPSQTYLCPRCGYGWNNDPYGRHGTAEGIAKALATNSLAVIITFAGVNLRWGLWSIIVAVVCVYGGAWLLGTAASLIEDHYDPAEKLTTSGSAL